MSDSYQAIYDAVRSRITGGDISEAVRQSLDFSHQATMVMQEWQNAAYEQMRPAVVMRPKVFQDGDHWCALYGEDIQHGVAGFGKSPAEANVGFRQELASEACCESGGSMSKPIRVFYSAFSGRLYATRHYKIENGLVTVTGEKFDVTSDVGAAVVEHGLTFTARPKPESENA